MSSFTVITFCTFVLRSLAADQSINDDWVDELFSRAVESSSDRQLDGTTLGKVAQLATPSSRTRPIVPLRVNAPLRGGSTSVGQWMQLRAPTTPRGAVAQAEEGEAAAEPILILGTRASPLALAQAYEVKARLAKAFPELAPEGAVKIQKLSTQGDERLDIPLATVGGKGLFTRELDVALAQKAVDFCVHSMKDVPTKLFDGSELIAMLPREDTRDVMIAGPDHPGVSKISDMPAGSVVGTASLRRQAQIYAVNPGVQCINFRGNVQTRLKKLNDKVVDFTLLALAGLNRMDMQDKASAILEWDEMLPAIAQGAIGIQVMSDDEKTKGYLSKLACKDTMTSVLCERAFLEVLDGNCKTPIAGQAKIQDGQVTFRGLVCSPDGKTVFRKEKTGPVETAVELGKEVGLEIRKEAGEKFFEEMQEYVQAVQAANTKPTKST
eukprot:gnl/TRDRNA2_/TRDRNA2_133090_c0_seq1.p1 gnl/TRDRNA2_/TRDRNA2_133090_c0~~gnl/TRDRNA2_/TRDRNA2_133090_c0_seq1.p1  ORF type:complete len:438 (+),score=83.38 gnl/TRDRNA2_/TRDRNA2_133090_c0_seq1:71-1384(+)